MVFLAQRN